MKSPFGRSRLLIDSFGGNPNRSRRFPSTHDVARNVGRIDSRFGDTQSEGPFRERNVARRRSDTIFGFEKEADAMQWI
jgi:hypothetical protein